MGERWQVSSSRETQHAEILALEAMLLPCPFCGCAEIRLDGIMGDGTFGHARCTKCRARATPDAWSKRPSGQRALFEEPRNA